MRSLPVFITGTDTGIGKTTVSSLLAEKLSGKGLSVAVCKPVETGVEPDSVPGDASKLLASSSAGQSLDEVCFDTFVDPVAPAVAFEAAGRAPNIDSWFKRIELLQLKGDLVLIEGAGGIMVPIFGNYSFLDLVKDGQWPVLVVVGSKLGALNHFSMTLDVLASRSIPILGYVFNEPFARGEDIKQYPMAHETNREQARLVAEHYNVVELASVPYLETPIQVSAEEAAMCLADSLLLRLGFVDSKSKAVGC